MKKNTDTVPAKLTPREAVLNRNAAELLGRDTIKRLNDHGNMLMKRGVDLASDPTPGPSTDNLEGYQYGSADVPMRDDRADLLRDTDTATYGGVPAPTPTPTPKPIGYQYGTDDVRRRRNAASRIPYGSGSGNAGFGLGSGLLAPEDNSAYQAALAKGRPSRTGYTMITTPSGGTMSVPIGQERKYTDLLFKGNTTADTGFQRPSAAAALALGNTGAVPTGNTPWERSYRMGFQGEGPVQTPQPSFGYQVGNVLRNAAPGALSLVTNAASRVGNAFSDLFGGGRDAASQYGSTVSSGTGSAASFPMTVPPGINNLVPPPPLTGRSPNEQMFPTGAGGALLLPSANPAQGTVTMANEAFPGNTGSGLPDGSQYPTAIQQPVANQALQTVQAMQQPQFPRRYSDLY